MSLPTVRDCVALHMAVLHTLTLPLPKLPTFLFKTMAKFLQQLTGTREPPKRATGQGNQPSSGVGDVPNAEALPDAMLINPPSSLATSQLFGSTSSIGSIAEPQTHLFKSVTDWKLVEEFEWLRLVVSRFVYFGFGRYAFTNMLWLMIFCT